jgi:quercetin dioxygenase-like cupin family protein
MKSVRLFVTTAVLLCAMTAAAQDSKPASPHVMVEEAQVKWKPASGALNKGAETAVLSGNPGMPGPFVMRIRMPAGYKIAPHWHPTDENVTVISGTLSLGMGETFDANATQSLAAGGFALLPAEMRHFAWTKDGATIQIHGIGPFKINYVNPADYPGEKAPGKKDPSQ